MRLKVGLKWGNSATEVTGVAKVTIGGHTWKCLKVAGLSQNSMVYAEWYVAENGRTVFFRRYNAPGWRKPEEHGSFESLAGNLDVEFRGITFRHWYDCIPDIALEKANE